MKSEDIKQLRGILPQGLPYVYFSDRESPWLLYHLISPEQRISEIRKSSLGKLLTRPLIKPVLACSSDGILKREDLYPVAEAETDIDRVNRTPAIEAALTTAFNEVWRDYTITLGAWGGTGHWAYQVSRPGHNLVLQLSFPSDHSELVGRYMRRGVRRDFEYEHHPVKKSGVPTLAWARLDIDLEAGVALIEEIQSDWLRLVADKIKNLKSGTGRPRELELHRAYLSGLEARYKKEWPRATMLAALKFLHVECSCHTVYIHTPESSYGFKYARGPRSLYTSLPKYFCFDPTEEVPPFLERVRRDDIKRLRRKHEALFWCLRFRDHAES